ncbi:MAG: META domain-containing protein [Bacteroidota bacterium]
MKKLLSIICLLSIMYAAYAQEASIQHLRKELWNVMPFKTSCYGMIPMQCLEYKKLDAKETATCFGIKGFTLEPGYQYLLSVQVDSFIHPPSDGSLYVYRLLKIVSKKPVISSAIVKNKTWVLVNMWHAERAPIDEALMKKVSLQINSKQFFGTSFCNNYAASYATKAARWYLTAIAGTKRFCDQQMELEQRYFELLQTVTFVVTEKNKLKLYNQAGDLILEYLEQKK